MTTNGPGSDFSIEIDDEQVKFFVENGFLSIDRITTDEEIDWLRTVWNEVFDERLAGTAGGYFDASRPNPLKHKGEVDLGQAMFPELRFPKLRETIYFRNARRIASRLLAVSEHKLENWGHMILKPALRGHETPWHQDEAYWPGDVSYHALGAWMPLDDADADNGCMQFVPRSHRQGILPHRHLHDDPSIIALVAEHADIAKAAAVPIRAGGATFHHPRTLHYTGTNRTTRVRRAYAIEFQTPPVPANAPIEKPWRAKT